MSLIAAEIAIAVIMPVPSRSPDTITDTINGADSGTSIPMVPMVAATPVTIETR